jgi:hypothetical protein
MTTSQTPKTPYLVTLDSGTGQARRIPLTREHLVVGRATTSDIRFDDEHVSRTHASLRQKGGRVWVQDLGSSGGTFVNGQPVTAAQELISGDVVSFATVQLRFAAAGESRDETTALPRQDARVVSRPTSDTRPPVRYDIGGQSAGSISNVGRDQYHSYVQQVTHQRQSFLREIAATRTKARWLIWIGLAMVVAGFGLFAAGVLNFIGQASNADLNSDISAPVDPAGLLGWAMGALGTFVLVVGIVLHVVATSRRKRVDREFPVPRPPRQVPGQWGG